MSSTSNEIDPLESDEEVLAATLDKDEALDEVVLTWAGPQCEKCGASMKSDGVQVCRRCGWYASLSTFVELDRNWDAHDDDEPASEEDEQAERKKVGLHMVPWWAWVIVGTVVAVIVESIAVRLATPNDSTIRTYWSLGQLGLGVLAFVGCHTFNFLTAAADDADLGLLDVFLKPLNLWIRAAKDLPHRLWVVSTAASGLTATVMSVAVIGGIPYDAIWHTGGKAKKPNMLATAVKQATKLQGNGDDNSLAETAGAVEGGDEGGSKSVEDAVGKAVGGGGGTTGKADRSELPPPEPRPTINCVILGYRLDDQGKISVLILGAAFKGKLAYAGFVVPPADDEDVAKLATQLERTKTDQPYLPLYTKATWVKPKFSCEISCQKRDRDGRLVDPKWETLVGAL